MRFMMLVIPKGYESAPADAMPDARAVAAMMQYNKALAQAGVLRALEGLAPPASGARVRFDTGVPVVRYGPFPEAREVVGGFWMIEVDSREEAVGWARRCPMMNGEMIEIRQVHEMADFPPDVQKAAAGFEEIQAAVDRSRGGPARRTASTFSRSPRFAGGPLPAFLRWVNEALGHRHRIDTAAFAPPGRIAGFGARATGSIPLENQ